MSMTDLVAAAHAFVTRINALFLQTRAAGFQALYIDNADGEFSVTPAPLVEALALVVDAEEKTFAETLAADHYDVRTHTWHRRVNGSWTTEPVPVPLVQPGRLYFSPLTRRVSFCDPNGTVISIRSQ